MPLRMAWNLNRGGGFVVLAAILLAVPGRASAQVPDAMYENALTVIQQYARDASLVVPCAHMAGLGDPNPKIVNQWGEPDVRRALDQFARRGASPAQNAALLKAFQDNYRPNFEAGDIRTFARACWDRGISESMYTTRGPAEQLVFRAPFAP